MDGWRTYEIVNPSDPYTVEHESLLALAAASIFLGRGQYSLRPITEGAEEVPFFMFGGFDAWWEAHSPGVDFGAWVDANKPLIAEAMDSVAMPKGQRRSSMNDIGGRAKEYAERLREGSTDGPRAPQQVFATE